jgi:hypothetical protein
MKSAQLSRRTQFTSTCACFIATLTLAVHAVSAPSTMANALMVNLPLAFEINQSEANDAAGFVARGQGYRLYLGQSHFEVQLAAAGNSAQSGISGVLTTRLRARLVGAAEKIKPEPLKMTAGSINYFHGNDAGQWRKGMPAFEQVQYRGVYPGIDLVFYGNQQSLEYDFIISPGSDPAKICLEFEGAQEAELDSEGALVLRCANGEFRHHAPVIYQMKNGSRIPIQGKYVLDKSLSPIPGNQTIARLRFSLGEYDRALPLWLDPILDYGTYLGGSGDDSGQGVAVDSSGNIYITGQTVSTDFPTTAGAFQSKCGTDGLCNGGHYDVFVTKLNPAGTTRLYSTYLGGSGDEQSWGIAVDNLGRAHVMGWTKSTDFPTLNAFQATNAGSRDAFVASFDDTGALFYSTYLGGSSDIDADIDGGIAVDQSGDVYVTGRTASPDFPVRNAFQNPSAGLKAFVSKFNPFSSGNASLLYSTCLGGTNGDNGATGIAVDSAGYAYITGYTTANDFPVKGAAQPLFGGIRDVFVAKLDTTQSGAAALLYSTYLGGSNEEAETSGDIAVDSLGQAWVTGATRSGLDFPVRNPVQSYGGDWDIFVTKLSASGSNFLFSTFLGGKGADGQLEAHIATDPAGNAYVTGQTLSGDFPVTQGIALGVDSVYVAKFDAAGTQIMFSMILGPGEGTGIVADSAENVYLTGQTTSQAFPVRNAIQSSLKGPSDAFLARLRPSTNDVAVQITPSFASIPIGSNLVYMVLVTNLGPDPATVIVTNLSNLSFAAFPADTFYSGTEVDSSPLLLAPHASRNILLAVRPVTVGALTLRSTLRPDDGDTNAFNNTAFAAVSAVAPSNAPPSNALRMRDWDYVALKADTGELVADTQLGVLGSPMGILQGAVNLMLTNRSRSIYLAQGPSGDGAVVFGFINKTNWLPANHDLIDLPSLSADRVYAKVDGNGNVQIISAAQFTGGVIIASNQVALSSDKSFQLVIDAVLDQASLYYGSQLLLQANPFVGGNSATRANIGNDFAVSILGGTGDLGYAILNDRSLKSPVTITSIRPFGTQQLQIAFQDAGSGAIGYSILSAPSPAGPWTAIPGATITGSGGGLFQATLSQPSSAAAFYRVQLIF